MNEERKFRERGRNLPQFILPLSGESQDVMPHLLTTLLSFSVNAAMMLVYK